MTVHFAALMHPTRNAFRSIQKDKLLRVHQHVGQVGPHAHVVGSGGKSVLLGLAIEEGQRVYRSVGIRWEQMPDRVERYKERAATMQFDIPAGDTFLGGSTWQSLMKGASTLETDFFNGEIIMLGRLHGVPTPVNEFLQHYAARMLREQIPPGSISTEALDAEWERSASA